MRNVLLTIAYDGSGFHGWQRQPEKRTVQGEVERALSQSLGGEIVIDGTSRTDAGVHALDQKATFKCDSNVPVEKLPMILNNALSNGRILGERISGDVKIVEAREVDLDFHARFNTVAKKYIYKISVEEDKDVFRRNYFYQISSPPDVALMKEATQYIVGTHDFKSFEASGSNPKDTTVRTVKSLEITEEEKEGVQGIDIEVTGDGFLYNMVRIIAGTLLEVGLGKRSPHSLKDTIESKNRENAGHTAPPTGLYLAEVYMQD